ncbi:MAG: HAMP domain-containing sensor histidine kinase [Pseudomonadota bacterium]
MPDKDRFLHRLVHDIRGPVRALADLPHWISEDMEARDDALPPAVVTMLRLVAENAGRLDELLARLAVFAAAGQGPMTEVEPIDPGTVIAAMPVPKGVDLKLELQACTVHVSVEDVTLLVRELIDNARKFHPDGAPTVTLRSQAQPGGGWALSICDDGPGFPQNMAHTAFQPLTRAACGHRSPGPGLGLAIVGALVARYGGAVRVQPSPGAHVVIRVPVRAPGGAIGKQSGP